MKKPTPVYYEKYSETAAKLIDDYTAEQCLYSLHRRTMFIFITKVLSKTSGVFGLYPIK